MPRLLQRIEKANANFPDYQYEFQLYTDEAEEFKKVFLADKKFIDIDKASEEHDVRVKITFTIEMFKKKPIEDRQFANSGFQIDQ